MSAVCSAVCSVGECAARGMSQKGGERAYRGCLGKVRSPRQSRSSMTSAKLRFTAQSTHSSKPQQIIAKGGFRSFENSFGVGTESGI
jgi:hypothetical protein